MHVLSSLLIATSVSAWLCFTAMPSVVIADTDREKSAMHVLSEGYLHNRSSFDSIDCRFTLTKTQSQNTVDAIAGKFVGKTISYSCVWLVNNKHVRFEKHCPQDLKNETAEVLARHMKPEAQNGSGVPRSAGNVIGVPCMDELFLRNTDSSYGLSLSELIESATLTPKGIRDEGGVRGTPFDMGVMAADEYSNPHRYLQDCITGRFVGKYVGTENIHGHNLEVVTLAHPGKPERMRFGFDPNRGYLPAYISDRAPEKGYKLTYEAFIVDAQKCSRDRWFPTHCVVVYPQDEPDKPIRVVDIKVTTLDVDNPPDRNRFNIEIPVGFQVNVPSLNNQWLNVKKVMKVGPDDLQQLHEQCIEEGKLYLEKRKRPKEQPTFAPASSRRAVLITTTGLLVIMTIILLVRIRRKKMPSS